jgi:hypothetical protein
MGTIIPRERKDGSTGYHAQVTIKRSGKIVHRETRTFDRKQAASAWLEKRESELAKPGAVERQAAPDPKLAAVIDRYIQESIKEIGRTKAQVLATIKNYEIADLKCSQVTSEKLVAFAKELLVQPQTVGNYLSHLASIFTIARPAWGYPLDAQAMEDAFVVAKKLGLTSKSVERDRRRWPNSTASCTISARSKPTGHSQTPCRRSSRSRFSAPDDRKKSPALHGQT